MYPSLRPDISSTGWPRYNLVPLDAVARVRCPTRPRRRRTVTAALVRSPRNMASPPRRPRSLAERDPNLGTPPGLSSLRKRCPPSDAENAAPDSDAASGRGCPPPPVDVAPAPRRVPAAAALPEPASGPAPPAAPALPEPAAPVAPVAPSVAPVAPWTAIATVFLVYALAVVGVWAVTNHWVTLEIRHFSLRCSELCPLHAHLEDNVTFGYHTGRRRGARLAPRHARGAARAADAHLVGGGRRAVGVPGRVSRATLARDRRGGPARADEEAEGRPRRPPPRGLRGREKRAARRGLALLGLVAPAAPPRELVSAQIYSFTHPSAPVHAQRAHKHAKAVYSRRI